MSISVRSSHLVTKARIKREEEGLALTTKNLDIEKKKSPKSLLFINYVTLIMVVLEEFYM